jgi:hypothetical protein
MATKNKKYLIMFYTVFKLSKHTDDKIASDVQLDPDTLKIKQMCDFWSSDWMSKKKPSRNFV